MFTSRFRVGRPHFNSGFDYNNVCFNNGYTSRVPLINNSSKSYIPIFCSRWTLYADRFVYRLERFCAMSRVPTSSRVFLAFLSVLVAVVVAEDDTSGPVFIKEPPNRVDFSNTTGAVVECSARGNPPPEIIWVRSDGTAVGDVPGKHKIV